MAVRIRPEAFLKFGEMLGSERAVFLGYPRDIGAGVVDPNLLRGEAFGEEDDICLGAGTVRGEGAVWEAKDGVEIAVFCEDFENFAGLVGKEDIVGDHNGCTASGLEDAHDMLDEIELLVAG